MTDAEMLDELESIDIALRNDGWTTSMTEGGVLTLCGPREFAPQEVDHPPLWMQDTSPIRMVWMVLSALRGERLEDDEYCPVSVYDRGPVVQLRQYLGDELLARLDALAGEDWESVCDPEVAR